MLSDVMAESLNVGRRKVCKRQRIIIATPSHANVYVKTCTRRPQKRFDGILSVQRFERFRTLRPLHFSARPRLGPRNINKACLHRLGCQLLSKNSANECHILISFFTTLNSGFFHLYLAWEPFLVGFCAVAPNPTTHWASLDTLYTLDNHMHVPRACSRHTEG